MAANTSVRISELDFITIRENLKNFLRSQSQFTDYDFEGSGMAVLLDLLAYNTHYMGYYLNMVGNEMFLDTAQLRESILSHAKLTNYLPTSKIGTTARVNITVTPSNTENTSTSTLTLYRYSRFLSQAINGINYPYVTDETYTATKANGSFQFSNVSIKQGEVVTKIYPVDSSNPERRFLIPSSDVDVSTIEVNVQESTSNSFVSHYELSRDITEITANSKIFFVEENPEANLSYTVQFGDGVIGKALDDGNIVVITYIDTDGKVANKSNTFISTDEVGGLFSDNVIVTPVSASAGGADKETIEEIRFRSPLFYSIQNRAVTKLDYESLILKDYPTIQAASVWGGEDNDPPVYGKIFISLQPKEGYFLTEPQKIDIIDQIVAERAILTVIPEIVDPEYLYFIVNTKISYDPTLTSLDEQALAALVRASIIDFRDNNLLGFSTTYRQSKLHRQLDSVHESFLGNQIDLFVQKRVPLTVGSSLNYTVNFGIPLAQGGFFERMYTFPTVSIVDSNGVTRDVYIEEVIESLSGIASIEMTNSGSNYSSIPTVTITGDGTGATAIATVVNGKIESIAVDDIGTGYTTATVTITGGGGTGGQARASLQANKAGLRTFYYKSNGEKVVVSEDVGTIYYDLGKIVLNNFTPIDVGSNSSYDDDVLTFNIKPASEIIVSTKNQIMTVDEDDSRSIQITMSPETA